MTDTLSHDVQAEKLRQFFVYRLHKAYLANGGPPVQADGSLTVDGQEYVITVQPKGLAELQAGLIAEVQRAIAPTVGPLGTSFEPWEKVGPIIAKAVTNYDAALASLGKKGGV